MQPIHIAREGASLGRFTAEDVAEGLRDGKFLPTDLAWKDPMPEWVPLSKFKGLPEMSSTNPAPTVAVAPPLPFQPAWENRAEIGFNKAVAETVSGLLMQPKNVFSSFQTTGGLRNPLLFLLLIGTLTGWVAIAYQYVQIMMNPEILAEAFKTFPPDKIWMLFAGMFVFVPIAVVVGAFLFCGIFHVALILLSKVPVPFETTFRIYCYAWGAASVFQLLPICGGYIYPLYAIYLTVIGLREVHKVHTAVALFAVLLPLFLCCGFLILGTGLGAAGTAVGTGK